MKKILAVLFVSLGLVASLFAHSGGTNASGCHNDNSPGGVYHCH